MDLRQLDMFRAVAEEGTFTKAAKRVHVTQSAISRQIKLLEDELGSVVLHRGQKRVALTSSGDLLLKTVHRVQRELQETISQISETRTLNRGSLSLAGGMTVCMYILPPVLKRFRALYPAVELTVTSAATSTLLDSLRRHELDLALLTLPIVGDEFEVRPALREEMVVVTAPGHPLSKKRPVDPQDLGSHPLILYESGSNTRKVLDDFFVEEKVAARVAMETENVEIIKAMVSNGLGVSIIPFAAAAKDVKAGRLAYSRMRGRKLFRETAWVYLRSDYVPKTVSEALRVFDMIKDKYLNAIPR